MKHDRILSDNFLLTPDIFSLASLKKPESFAAFIASWNICSISNLSDIQHGHVYHLHVNACLFAFMLINSTGIDLTSTVSTV